MIKIIFSKKQTLNFNFNQNLTGQTGIFILSKNNNIILSKQLTAIDETQGKYKLDLTSDDADIDLGVYDYKCEFNVNGIVETGDIYLVNNINLRIEEIKRKYGFIFDYETMLNAYKHATKQVVNFIFSDSEDKTYNTWNKVIQIDNYVADNLDYGFVNKENIRIYQYKTVPPYSVQELNDKIVDILFDYPTGKTIITMDDEYPSEEYEMKVEYKRISKKFSNIYDIYKYIQELYIYLYLLDHLEINKLQMGLTTKEINGVSFTFDKESIDDLKVKIRQWIDNESIIFQDIIIKDVNISNIY